jgi:hypothetical protein
VVNYYHGMVSTATVAWCHTCHRQKVTQVDDYEQVFSTCRAAHQPLFWRARWQDVLHPQQHSHKQAALSQPSLLVAARSSDCSTNRPAWVLTMTQRSLTISTTLTAPHLATGTSLSPDMPSSESEGPDNAGWPPTVSNMSHVCHQPITCVAHLLKPESAEKYKLQTTTQSCSKPASVSRSSY